MAHPSRAASLTARLTLLVLGALPLAAHAARAQGAAGREMRIRAELGAAVSSPWMKDGNGTRVTSGVAPALGLSAAWSVAPAWMLSAGLRASRASLTFEDDGRSWGDDHVTQLDLVGAVERDLLGCGAGAWCLGAHAAVGAALVRGPGDVAPFRFSTGARQLHPAVEAGASARLTRSLPLALAVTAQALRFGGAIAGDPITEPAWVRRVIVGVRYAR